MTCTHMRAFFLFPSSLSLSFSISLSHVHTLCHRESTYTHTHRVSLGKKVNSVGKPNCVLLCLQCYERYILAHSRTPLHTSQCSPLTPSWLSHPLPVSVSSSSDRSIFAATHWLSVFSILGRCISPRTLQIDPLSVVRPSRPFTHHCWVIEAPSGPCRHRP